MLSKKGLRTSPNSNSADSEGGTTLEAAMRGRRRGDRIGRPSVDSQLMIRMLVIGYCYGLCLNAG
jgi:hypothetical protein